MKLPQYRNTLFILALTIISFPIHAQTSVLSMELNKNWEFRQTGTSIWLPASVPGTVHTDLLANKKIEDPYNRLNETGLQWIDKANWEYGLHSIFRLKRPTSRTLPWNSMVWTRMPI